MLKKLLFLVMFVILSLNVSATIFSVEAGCIKDVCLEGENVEWIVSLENENEADSEILGAYVRDLDTDELIAWETNLDNDISAGEKEVFDIESRLGTSSETSEYEKNVISCFKVEFKEGNLKGDIKEVCGKEPVTVKILPKSLKECSLNVDCGENKGCVDYRCGDLSCGECGYILNNRCKQYECCESSDCGGNEFCEDHTCKALECGADETVSGNKCVKLFCADDEIVSEHRCVRLNCPGYSKAANHQCVELNCGLLRKGENNKCVSDDLGIAVTITIGSLMVGIILGFYFYRKYKQPKELHPTMRKYYR